MDPWQRLMRRSTGGGHVRGLECVEPFGGLGVGRPAVADDPAPGLDVGEQELLQVSWSRQGRPVCWRSHGSEMETRLQENQGSRLGSPP